MAVIKTGLATVGSNIQPIGTWSATKRHDLGLKVHRPADADGAAQTFMYVQFNKDSGVDAYQGSPCGWVKTTLTATNYAVNCDVSASPSTTPCGIIMNTSTTAATDNYYGWIQLAVPGEILKSVLLTSGIANNDLVVWETDQNLEAATAFTSLLDVIDTPFGMVCTGITQGATSTVVSTSTVGDVIVLLNPYVT